MSMQAQTTSSYTLPPVLDFAAAEGFQASLIEKLQAAPTLHLDASAVETLTTPCVQLILAAAKSHHLTIANPSVAFNSAFTDLGLNWEDYAEASGDSAVAQSAAQIAEVMQAVETALIEATASETPDIADSEQPNGSAMAKRILTIDDSKTMRDMLMLTLSDAGYDVIQAVDGEDGVNVLKDQTVDVVITDINMPKMDGYEVIRQLRKNPAHKTLPILVLTTESDTDKRSIAREAGATGWMVKPFDPDRLVQTIRKVSP
jgi:two-component system chemotaxis response regulator CheY